MMMDETDANLTSPWRGEVALKGRVGVKSRVVRLPPPVANAPTSPLQGEVR